MKNFFIFTLFLICCSLSALPIVKNGKSDAEIVVPERVSPVIALAARELQLWIRNISGAELPIHMRPSERNNVKFLLGGDYAKAFGKDLKELAGGDGCAVRNQGKNIYLFGAEDRAALHAVMWLLDKNTDLIFARPVDGAVYSECEDLDFKSIDFIEKPTWKQREFGLCDPHFNPITHLWSIRNFANTRTVFYAKRHIFSVTNHFFSAPLGYEFGKLVPNEKYFEKHPEFYSWQEGKRKPYSHYGPQLCYTNEAGREAVVKELMKRLEKDLTPETKVVSFSFGDTWSLCECPECQKPIKRPDGAIVEPSDEAFRSTQFYLYMNKITEEIIKKYPHLIVSKLAYLYAAVPPKVKLHPRLRPLFCPYPKDNKQSVFGPKNKKWGDRSRTWPEVSKRTGVFEYFGDSSEFPRPISDVAVESLKEWNRLGINSIIYSETCCDVRRKDNTTSPAVAWDVSAMEYWTLSRLFWNSDQNVDELKRKYLNRTYREAAQPMADYYETIRKVWYDDPRISFWNDNPVYSAYHYIRKKGLEKKLRVYLEAAERQATHPVSKKLVQLHREQFEYWMKESKKRIRPPMTIPLVEASSNLGDDFDNSQWEKGTKLELRRDWEKPETEYRTMVFLLHDRLNLYAKFVCDNPVPPVARDKKDKEKERYWFGDKVSLFLASAQDSQKNNDYFHFAVGPDGERYDSQAYAKQWNSNFRVVTEKKERRWQVIMTVPLTDVGINISKYNKIKFLTTRCRQDDRDGDKEVLYTYRDRQEHRPKRLLEAVLQE